MLAALTYCPEESVGMENVIIKPKSSGIGKLSELCPTDVLINYVSIKIVIKKTIQWHWKAYKCWIYKAELELI